jgi:hypothetical protein
MNKADIEGERAHGNYHENSDPGDNGALTFLI